MSSNTFSYIEWGGKKRAKWQSDFPAIDNLGWNCSSRIKPFGCLSLSWLIIVVFNAMCWMETDWASGNHNDLHILPVHRVGHYQARGDLCVRSQSYPSNSCHYPCWCQDYLSTAPCFCFPPDPVQPFLMRGGSSSELETIYVTRSAMHVIVPCLVTIPDLNVILQSVCFHLLCHQLNLSSV